MEDFYPQSALYPLECLAPCPLPVSHVWIEGKEALGIQGITSSILWGHLVETPQISSGFKEKIPTRS